MEWNYATYAFSIGGLIKVSSSSSSLSSDPTGTTLFSSCELGRISRSILRFLSIPRLLVTRSRGEGTKLVAFSSADATLAKTKHKIKDITRGKRICYILLITYFFDIKFRL